MNYLILLLLLTLTTYSEGKSLYFIILNIISYELWVWCGGMTQPEQMWDCQCAGNAEAGPGYVTCSETDPAAALPNNKKIEVICYLDN